MARTIRRVSMMAVLVGAAAWPAWADAEKPVSLFNGKDLSGWEKKNGGEYTVEKGVLVLDGGNGWLKSEREFEDFELTVEWRADPKYKDPKLSYDSGVFFRAVAEGNPWPKPAYQLGLFEGKEGGVGGLTKESFPQLINPPGEWNTYVVVAKGPVVEVTINGKPAFKSDKAAVRKGYIGFQAEGHRFEFRKVDIKELGSSK